MSTPPSLPPLSALLLGSSTSAPPAVPELHHLATVAAAQPRHVPRILSPTTDALLSSQPGPATSYPSLLSSLAHHRLPRPSAPTFHPPVIRSASSASPSAARPHRPPSLSPSRRRASHSSGLPSPPSNPPHSPAAASAERQNYFIKPRGPSYLSTLPTPGFPLPSYLSHSAFRAVLHTSPFASAEPKPAEYAVPTAVGQVVNGAAGGQSSARRVARHSDSDTSPTPTRRRARSGPLPPAPGASLPSPASPAPSPSLLSPTTPLHLPTKFSETDHSPSLSLSADGLTLSYTGVSTTGGDRDAASARSDHPIPPHVGVYYYEIEVVEKGASGFISLGLCTRDMNLGRLPGWEKDSWGYHGDDGHCFAWTASDMEYGPKFSTGDVVGCGIDYATGQAFYTKNGLFLGPIFDSLPSSGPLFACIGLRSSNEVIRANFGQKDFVYDIDGYVRRRKESVQREVGRWGMRSAGLGLGEAGRVNVVFVGMGETGEDAASAAAGRRRRRLTMTDGAPPSAGAGPSTKKEKTPKSKKDSISEPLHAMETGGAGSSRGHGLVRGTDEEARRAEELKLALDTLVLDYLSSTGYAGSAVALSDGMRARYAPEDSDGMEVDLPRGRREPGRVYPVLDTESVRRRQRVADAIGRGDVDVACREIGEGWPGLLQVSFPPSASVVQEVEEDGDEDEGMQPETESEGWKGMDVQGRGPEGAELVCRLECRKFVELVLHSSTPSVSLPTSSTLTPTLHHPHSDSDLAPAPTPPTPELSRAIAYGQHLYHKYAASPSTSTAGAEGRPGHLQAMVERTFGVLAYARPLDAAGEVGDLVRPSARSELASWVNSVILREESRNERPALERAWAGARAVLGLLGGVGVGKAAWLDVEEEFGTVVRRPA